MELRIKEVCKEKGVQLKEVAEKMGIAPESLSRIIKGNPQIETLEKVALALEVDITDLFYKSNSTIVTGYLEYKNEIKKINNLSDLKKLIEEIEKNTSN